MSEQQPPQQDGILPADMLFDTAQSNRRRKRRSNGPWARLTRRPRRFFRKHKALSILIGVVALLLLILLLWLWWLLHNLHKAPDFDVDFGDNRPPYYGGENILLVGLDCDTSAPESDTLRACEKQEKLELDNLDSETPTGVRSDVLMVLHVSEDGQAAQIVSIPRDSYVEVDGHGKTKVNAAFSYGGPSLLGRTIEQNFGIHITHMAVVDFNGFRGITEALGGVPVYIPEDVTLGGIVAWEQGWHNLQGEDALGYVRTRYGLARGDFDRVQRHQNFLRSVLHKARDTSVVFNPFRLTNLVEEVTGHLALDSGFSDGKVFDLTVAGLNLGADAISYATVPYEGSATIDGASVVLLKEKEARDLFDAIAHDTFLSYLGDHEVETLPPEQEVR